MPELGLDYPDKIQDDYVYAIDWAGLKEFKPNFRFGWYGKGTTDIRQIEQFVKEGVTQIQFNTWKRKNQDKEARYRSVAQQLDNGVKPSEVRIDDWSETAQRMLKRKISYEFFCVYVATKLARAYNLIPYDIAPALFPEEISYASACSRQAYLGEMKRQIDSHYGFDEVYEVFTFYLNPKNFEKASVNLTANMLTLNVLLGKRSFTVLKKYMVMNS